MIKLVINKNDVHSIILINLLKQNLLDFEIFSENNIIEPQLIVNSNNEEIIFKGFNNITKNIEYIRHLIN